MPAGPCCPVLAVRVTEVLKERGARNIYVFASHGIFSAKAIQKVEECESIHRVVVTNTLPLPEGYEGTKVSACFRGGHARAVGAQDHGA
jgi:phosphoribosylpyrophosphate synthetase